MHLFLVFVALFVAVALAVDCGDGADFQSDACVCPPGRFQGQGDDCLPCPAGKSSSRAGSKECDVCAVGFVPSAKLAGQCVACPEGTTTASAGQVVCDRCVDGYYGASNGLAPCHPCPSGYTTNAAMGHRDCIACVGPTFNCRSFMSRDSREEIINNLARAVDSINAAIKEIYSNLMHIQRRLDYRHVDEEYKQSIEHG